MLREGSFVQVKGEQIFGYIVKLLNSEWAIVRATDGSEGKMLTSTLEVVAGVSSRAY